MIAALRRRLDGLCSLLSHPDRRASRRLPATLGATVLGAIVLSLPAGAARAEVPVQRTFYQLASSNGHGAVMLDLTQARLTHFREHLFAAEEPTLDAAGNEVWNGNQPQSVASRDLLFDAYFGLRAEGNQHWLTSVPVDLDASGYAGWKAGAKGGTGIATMVQHDGVLTATQYFFAPRGLPHDGFVMAMRIQNTGGATVPSVSAFSLHNFHLGFGRPGVRNDIGEQGETVSFDGANGKADLLERAFAGVIVARPLGPVTHHASSDSASPPAASVYSIVNNGGVVNLPDLNGNAATHDGSVSAFQVDLGDIPAGEERWAGVAFAHDGDPFAGATVQGFLDAYVAGKTAKALVDEEIASYATFQNGLTIPPGLGEGEETLLRHSAVVLAMAQNQEDKTFLREFLTTDGEPRKTRFGTVLGGAPAALPNTVAHRGKGAVIASLPPGEWTVAWIRDGAYAVTAMAALGMKDQARDALSFYVGAEGGRFEKWSELQPYSMPPYLISTVRYHGFGVEETDFNDFGPNLEFDGFGLFLWALHHYEKKTGDQTLVDGAWPVVSTKVADVLVALIDPSTGLLRKDSSIWESHWKGRERAWTYTNITAVRGLCDAATLATRIGDAARAQTYHDAGVALRAAIAQKLTDAQGALASNAEELAVGEGYWDAAVLDAIAMGLFDPKGKIAKATLAGLDQHLTAPAGAGWSRNDDLTDHAGVSDVSPWGSDYDSAEWVVTDLRGAVAERLAGDTVRADRLLHWVRDQSLANYLAVSETYDPQTGKYKFNAPMVGFGAGVYALALFGVNETLDAPACGAFFDESGSSSSSSSSSSSGSGGSSSSSSSGGTGGTGAGGSGTSSSSASSSGSASSSSGGTGGASSGGLDDGGCGCRLAPGEDGAGWALALAGAALAAPVLRRRGARRRR